ncbi:MAG: hypothetical protein ABFD86_00620 [Bryobacteraceae bacterium]
MTEDSGVGVMTDCALQFAQLVDAIIDGSLLTTKGLTSGEANTLRNAVTPAESSNEPEADDSEEPDAAPVRPDLIALPAAVLPLPVPISMPQIESGAGESPDLKPREAECEIPGALPAAEKVVDSPSMLEPVVGTETINAAALEIPAGTSFVDEPVQEVAPGITAVPAEEVPADGTRSAATPQPLEATETGPKQEPVAPSLAFSLRLKELDKSPQPGSNSVRTTTSSEPVPSEATPLQPRTPVTPLRPVAQAESAQAEATPVKLRAAASTARPVAQNAAVANIRASSSNEHTAAPRPAAEPSRPVTRTDSGMEDAPKQDKVRATASENPNAPRQDHPAASTVRSVESVPASTGVTPHARPVLSTDARPAAVTTTDPLPRTEIVERINVNRVDAAQPRTARDIVVQIPADNSNKVEVQVAERGGEVRVAVRTADAALNQSLRTELGSLVARLETAGYRADSITSPESFVSSSSQARQDPSSSEQNASRGFSGQGQESSHQQGGSGQQRQGEHPDRWAEQFARSLTPDQDAGQENSSWQSIFNR